MANADVVAALDRLAAAVNNLEGSPAGAVIMQAKVCPFPTLVATDHLQHYPTVSDGAGGLVRDSAPESFVKRLKFTFNEVFNPRDLVSIAGTVTIRSSGQKASNWQHVDKVFIFSSQGNVGVSGSDVILNHIFEGLVRYANTTPYPVSAWSIQAWSPTSCVRYVGT